MDSLQRLLEYCEKALTLSDKGYDNAKTVESMYVNKGAVLAYSSVIAQIREEMKNENSGGN